MDREAFTVLPPLSPRLPPPAPTPAPTRLAPRTVASKESEAFVILAELGDPVPSGRSSPFRGRGFRRPQSPPSFQLQQQQVTSRIPVPAGKSAPSSPARKPKPTPSGKSAPSSPKRVTARPPVPKKRTELPAKTETIKPRSKPLKEANNNSKRLTAKPPIPKSPRKFVQKTPQPAKRSEHLKPAPAARNRLQNKPISTDLKIGSLKKATTTVTGVKKTAVRLNSLSKETLLPPDPFQQSQSDQNQVESPSEAGDPDTTTKLEQSEPEVHKLSIEINSGPCLDAGNDGVTVVEVLPQKSQDEVTISNTKPADTTKSESVNVSEAPTKTAEPIKNGIIVVEAAKPVPETVIPNGVTVIEEITSAEKDATIVKWTTKQPLELAQPDVIPSDATGVVETQETVQGPPEVEVEAGNHTVSFRSPEIHPVSPRLPTKKTIYKRISDRMTNCCKRGKMKSKIKPVEKSEPVKKEMKKPHFWSKLCSRKKKTTQPAQQAAKAKKKGGNLMSKLNCCKQKAVSRPPPIGQAGVKPSIWRKVFCLDKACCARCRRDKPPSEPAKLTEPKIKRNSSVAAVQGLPKLDMALVEHTSVMKGAIPVLPICLAWLCLILNVFLPGSGTIISGFLCTCFGKPRFSVNDSGVARLGSLCVNIIVGISQMFTIIFCLVGWGWSIWWGIIMLKVSRKKRRITLAEKNADGPAPVTLNQNHDVERG